MHEKQGQDAFLSQLTGHLGKWGKEQSDGGTKEGEVQSL